MELKPGDVVILRSGGHPMTVVEVNENAIACLWMGDQGDLFRETLPLAALEGAEIADSDDEEAEEDEDEEDEDETEQSKVA